MVAPGDDASCSVEHRRRDAARGGYNTLTCCRQQGASSSGVDVNSSIAPRSLADRRPWWPLAQHGNGKHAVTSSSSSSSSSSSDGIRSQRNWSATRQPGISLAPSLAPANGSIPDSQGTAPAEARPREERSSAQPQEPERQHDSLLLSTATALGHEHEEQVSARSSKAADSASRQPKCKPAQQPATPRTPLAQHFAAHGPPKLIFFDLETTGAMHMRHPASPPTLVVICKTCITICCALQVLV